LAQNEKSHGFVGPPPRGGWSRRPLAIAVRLTAVLVLLCGVAYPALIYAGAHLAFRAIAEGSAVLDPCGVPRGSRLIGQSFTAPSYFWGRPSAVGYDARNSGASNFGPLSPALRDSLSARASALRSSNSIPADAALTPDAISGSGSGLDPDISPEFAMLQVRRVARARSAGGDDPVFSNTVRSLVTARTLARQFGILGEPRVNVLTLNVALDSIDDLAHARRRSCDPPASARRSP
jgi:K+-transporting ATPase ATPase C chain